MEMIRFLAVSVLGVLVDICIAWTLAQTLDLPLWICAAVGFAVAALGNYALHEIWTFRREDVGLSRRRGAHYLGAAVATLLVRLAVVATLEHMLGTGWALAILIAGAGLSFFVNFALSKFLVFNEPDTGKTRL